MALISQRYSHGQKTPQSKALRSFIPRSQAHTLQCQRLLPQSQIRCITQLLAKYLALHPHTGLPLRNWHYYCYSRESHLLFVYIYCRLQSSSIALSFPISNISKEYMHGGHLFTTTTATLPPDSIVYLPFITIVVVDTSSPYYSNLTT